MEMKRGFSLVELIIVMALISLLALAMSSVMLTTIANSNRVRTLTKIKQAGDYTINQFQSLVRNARTISVCDSTNQLITLESPDGASTTIQLANDNSVSPSVDRIASNSALYLTPQDLKVTSYTLSCQPGDMPAAYGQPETSLVKLSFDLQSSAANLRTQENPTLHFETAAELRNQ
jgi:prepilin-type N-terminal cleavage/methylation domain-containing protein